MQNTLTKESIMAEYKLQMRKHPLCNHLTMCHINPDGRVLFRHDCSLCGEKRTHSIPPKGTPIKINQLQLIIADCGCRLHEDCEKCNPAKYGQCEKPKTGGEDGKATCS